MDAPVDEPSAAHESSSMGCEHTYNHAERAAAALCDLRMQRIQQASIRCPGAYAPLAVIHDGCVHLSQPIDELMRTLFVQHVVFTAVQGQLPVDCLHTLREVESLERFCWRFGETIARERGLLPWLSKRERYRLLAWPDFGEIGSNPEGARFCQWLARESLSPLQISRRLNASVMQTSGWFNSAALCGVLVAEASVLGSKRVGHSAGSTTLSSALGYVWRRLKI